MRVLFVIRAFGFQRGGLAAAGFPEGEQRTEHLFTRTSVHMGISTAIEILRPRKTNIFGPNAFPCFVLVIATLLMELIPARLSTGVD